MLENLIRSAAGKEEADLILKNARIMNVFTGEIVRGNVAVTGGRIAGIGDYADARQTVDLEGRCLAPGFINAHCHVESSMATPARYCAEELHWGVTTLITDPHEVANVAGLLGIRYMLNASQGIPINYYVQLPSCVPSTSFEHAGAVLSADDLAPLLREPRVLGLGEMMDYPGVLGCSPAVMEKLRMAKGRIVDGHAPSLTGKELAAYASAGITTDHESVSYQEAKEKLGIGMAVLVREGSASKNLSEIVTGIVAENLPTSHMGFCTDDKHLADIRREGTILHCIRKAISLGLETPKAYQMATINAARIYGLKDLGAIAPGYRADMVVLDDFDAPKHVQVYKDGRLIRPDEVSLPANLVTPPSVNMKSLEPHSFALPDFGEVFPVVRIVPGQLLTEKASVSKSDISGAITVGRLCKLAVAERHHATGNIGVGLLEGFGLKDGAIASTVCHDSHNLMIIGHSDADMLAAAEEVRQMGGGIAVVRGGRVLAALKLPVFGLMSNEEPETIITGLERILYLMQKLGVCTKGDPLVTMSFLALPVIPEIRVTDMGIFDVTRFGFLAPQ